MTFQIRLPIMRCLPENHSCVAGAAAIPVRRPSHFPAWVLRRSYLDLPPAPSLPAALFFSFSFSVSSTSPSSASCLMACLSTGPSLTPHPPCLALHMPSSMASSACRPISRHPSASTLSSLGFFGRCTPVMVSPSGRYSTDSALWSCALIPGSTLPSPSLGATSGSARIQSSWLSWPPLAYVALSGPAETSMFSSAITRSHLSALVGYGALTLPPLSSASGSSAFRSPITM